MCQQKKIFFVTGIGTEVGKTLMAAVITESLQADYWKPIQSGNMEYSDTDVVRSLITNTRSKFFPNSYTLKHPLSPHAAAEMEGISICLQKIKEPQTKKTLVIEGAGGLLVPLNEKNTILDLIKPLYKVVVVSRHYLGSINHTLMTIEMLQYKKICPAGIVFNGTKNTATERIIAQKTKIPILGRIDQEKIINKTVVRKYAHRFRPSLEKL